MSRPSDLPQQAQQPQRRPRPWDVWLINFDPQLGHEQAGERPGIIVGSDYACRLPNRLVLVAPCTTTLRRLEYQPVVALQQPSAVMCDQVKSLDRQRLIRRLPHSLKAEDIDQIRFVLRRMFA